MTGKVRGLVTALLRKTAIRAIDTVCGSVCECVCVLMRSRVLESSFPHEAAKRQLFTDICSSPDSADSVSLLTLLQISRYRVFEPLLAVWVHPHIPLICFASIYLSGADAACLSDQNSPLSLR